MSLIELILIGIGLSMDAFAVSLCKGLAMVKFNYKNCTIISLFFGVSQALMILLGFLLTSQFESYIRNFGHWIAFILLTCIGAKMFYGSFSDRHKEQSNQGLGELNTQTSQLGLQADGQAEVTNKPISNFANSSANIFSSKVASKANSKLSMTELSILAIATSIDALAVGVTFALLPNINILFSATLIGAITFSLSFFAVFLGTIFGDRYEKKAERAGGIILIAIGVKILLDHFEILF